MQVSERFIADREDVSQGTDGMQQPLNASSVFLEILKRLDYGNRCEVPTLLDLALSHVIAYLLHQDEKPFEAPAEPFQRCFSRVPVIRYLASQQLLIPLLKRVPETLSMSKLKLSEFLNPEECLYLLQTFGKNLSCLYFYRSSLSIENLAKLAPNLKDIEANEPLTGDELRQLMSHYPNIQRVGPTALRAIDSAALRELLQTCAELTDLDYDPPYDMPTALVSLKDIFCLSLRKLRISNAVEDAFGFATRCPNLTFLEITAIDVNDPLRTTLQQCSNLTELSLPLFVKTDRVIAEPTNPNFTTFDKISRVTGNAALIQKCFSVTFPNAEIWMKLFGNQFTKTFFETKQNIRSISYVGFYSDDKADFQRCLEFSGASLESIDLGRSDAASDIEIDGIISHCKKLERLACARPAFESGALISLFKTTVLKKVEMLGGGNCNDQAVQSLLEKSGKSLVHLKISDGPITNQSLRIIAQFGRGLKKLDLRDCDQILGADLVQLVLGTPNLKVALFGNNLSNDDVALMSQRLPNLRRVVFAVNDSFDIEKGGKCFSDDIAIEFHDKDCLIFQNKKANTKNPRNLWLKNGFICFNDLRNGIFFRGYVKNDMPYRGKGKLINAAGDTYEGDWQNGMKHGNGKCTWAHGDSYEGNYQDGKFHGKGKYTCANGMTYEGEWQNGMLHGFGILTFLDGSVYEVEHINDKLVKSLPCNPDGSDLKKQLIEVEGEGKEPRKSEEAESKGQKTSRSEMREEEEKADGNPLKKRSRARNTKRPKNASRFCGRGGRIITLTEKK